MEMGYLETFLKIMFAHQKNQPSQNVSKTPPLGMALSIHYCPPCWLLFTCQVPLWYHHCTLQYLLLLLIASSILIGTT